MKQTKYPIYIISKSRWESRLTSKALEEIGLDYKIVVEPQEYDNYAAVIDPKKILVLPFSNLGLGGIPARNWVWEHSVAAGDARHWICDDNIRYFIRLHKNTKLRVKSSVPFTAVEEFVDRFENVKMAGMNYDYFNPANDAKAPYYLNTRVYSCILLSNDIPNRWRVLKYKGKDAPFNEDTDLSLSILKDGWCTILTNAFCCGKVPTHTMKGGNTSEVYKLGEKEFDNRYTFAASLKEAHPDHVEIVQRYGRWHHFVDYSPFERTPLILKKDHVKPQKNDEMGLKLVRLDVVTGNPVEIIEHTKPNFSLLSKE